MTEASAKVCLIPATSLVDGLIIYNCEPRNNVRLVH